MRNIEQYSTDLKFNNDGTKMFTIGDQGDAVDEFTLSTAFDVSTAMHAGNSESFSVHSQEGRPQGFAFNNDGTKMYVVGFGSDFVYEYNLTTAFDVSTASHAGNSEGLDVSGEDGSPKGLRFNNDGTIMYIVGSATDSIYQYALSTAFDVSTSVYSGISFVVAEDTNPTDFMFNNDGTKMYVVGSNNDKIYEYNIIDSSITVSPTSNTDYTVIGTDVNGCFGYDTISVTVNPLPSVEMIKQFVHLIVLLYNGASTYDWDLVGKSSLQFDGVNDNVNLGNSTSLDLRNDFTLEANIKLDGTNSNNIIFTNPMKPTIQVHRKDICSEQC